MDELIDILEQIRDNTFQLFEMYEEVETEFSEALEVAEEQKKDDLIVKIKELQKMYIHDTVKDAYLLERISNETEDILAEIAK